MYTALPRRRFVALIFITLIAAGCSNGSIYVRDSRDWIARPDPARIRRIDDRRSALRARAASVARQCTGARVRVATRRPFRRIRVRDAIRRIAVRCCTALTADTERATSKAV